MSAPISFRLVATLIPLFVAACGSGGNLKTDNTYHGSPPPKVEDAKFDPYRQTPVTWDAPTYDRHGTIVQPQDPTVMKTFEDYQDQSWFPGAGQAKHPAGSW